MRRRVQLVRLIKEYRVEWAVATLGLYIVMVPITILIFPGNSLLLALIVLFSGATSSITTLGDLLVSAEDDTRQREDPAD